MNGFSPRRDAYIVSPEPGLAVSLLHIHEKARMNKVIVPAFASQILCLLHRTFVFVFLFCFFPLLHILLSDYHLGNTFKSADSFPELFLPFSHRAASSNLNRKTIISDCTQGSYQV